VRVIGATNKDLKELVEKGEFREDLYYRINVFPLQLPPLRERRKDIIPLADHFLHRCGQAMGKPNPNITDEAKQILFKYSWPGNIRELQNAIERAAILSTDDPVGPNHLRFLTYTSEKQWYDEPFLLSDGGLSLEALELDLVRQALERTNHTQTEAAKLLGLSRGKFRCLAKRFRNYNN